MSAHAVLSVLKEGEILKEITLEENREINLGRADGCVIRLPDRAVSREHAVFRLLEEGGVQVEKKSDFGPIQVNGAECTRGLLKNGDIVAIGPYLMKVSIERNEKIRRKNQEKSTGESNEDARDPQVNSPAPISANALGIVAKSEAINASTAKRLETLENPTRILNQSEESPFELNEAKAKFSDFSQENNRDAEEEENSSLSIDRNGTPDAEVKEPGFDSQKPEFTSFNEVDGDAKTKILTSQPLQVFLKFRSGDANHEEYPLDAENLEIGIGRGRDCEVVLNDKKCSRKNSIIRRNGLQFEIEDLGSVNGTWVNGKKVQKQELSSGDRVRIGDIEFTFQAKDKDYEQKAAQIVDLPPIEDEVPDLALSQEMPAMPAGAISGVPAPMLGAQAPAVAFAPQPGVALDPGQSGVTAGGAPSFNFDAVAGIGDVNKKRTLLEKFKAQPKPRQILIVAGIALLFLFLLEEEETPKKKVTAKPSPVASAKAEKVIATFESLSPEQQRYVELQYQLAFDHLRNREFDKALYEVQKIFVLIPDYKEARSIERYAKEGKRKIEAIEEEKRKKEDEARLKAKIEQLVQEIEANIKKRKFDDARILFSDLLAIDPENPNIDRWRSEMDRYEQETEIAEQRRLKQKEINERGRVALQEADELAAQKKYYPAIDAYQLVFEVPVSDKSIHESAKSGIANVEKAIQDERDPVLVEARQLEQNNEESKAFKLYEKATQIDPKHPEGYAGMERIRGLLHERAKAIYTEAVLAESYSDLATAKRKYQEVLEVVPSDDIYFDRAKRKLVPYVRNAVPDEGT